ncbi:MAG: type II/IV secretion system protein [Phycisphaeraceae bacterium]|nr:type II/IV secretion system protein [Phycisphaeraceae bacterium]MCW5754947.1 type II/IV secretion system protein [Phycisphaeraceae bacterium]
MTLAPSNPMSLSDAPPAAAVPGASWDALFAELIDQEFARRHMLAPAPYGTGDPLSADISAGTLLAAAHTSPAAIWNCAARLRREVTIAASPPEDIARRLDEVYAHRADRWASIASTPEWDDDRTARLLADAEQDILATAGKGPVVQIVDAMLFQALSRKASDVHIQPIEGSTLVRFRIDGVLHTWKRLDPGLARATASRIKVMAKMDIAERRLAQDGRASVSIGTSGARDATKSQSGRTIDLRVSTLPTSHGERIVVRLLETAPARPHASFADLGMPADTETAFLERAGRAGGIVLVTGPTGSGKTTTLYTVLRWLSCRQHASTVSGCPVNIMTIEDPIEYALAIEGVSISQTQVNTRKGVTFSTGLRHILRQDPDVIMVGEIRDTETARLALQASLTGHLVFSTLHTNDTATAATRLLDLEAEPYLVSDSLSCVLAQRLVRRRHVKCRGNGCPDCLHAGFLGRIGLFELLIVTDSVRSAIANGAAASQLLALAKSQGMRTLSDEGSRLTRQGITTPEEVRRVAFGVDPLLHGLVPEGGQA